MSGVFGLINNINTSKENVFAQHQEKDYVPFIVNKSLSLHADTLMHSNEMNKRPFIPKRYQYEYLHLSVRKRKRFSKWFKKDEQEDLELVKQYFKVSSQKASEYIKILTKENMEKIKSSMYRGGLD